MNRKTLVAAFTVFAIAASAVPARSRPAQGSTWGWYIAINTTRTETRSIAFFLAGASQAQMSWQRGQQAVFFVPEAFRYNRQLNLRAAVGDNGKDAWFCVDFKEQNGDLHGVKHFDFDDSEDHSINANDRDNECGG